MVDENYKDDEIRRLGVNASRVFGRRESRNAVNLLYEKSPEEIAAAIFQLELPRDRRYGLVDFGGFKGQLLRSVIAALSWRGYSRCDGSIVDRFKFKSGKTVEYEDPFQGEFNIFPSPANMPLEKISSELTDIPLDDNAKDIGICRYALHWNSLENQQKMLKEFARICRFGTVVQHISPAPHEDYFDQEDKQLGLENWRDSMDNLFSGRDVSRIRRQNHYFSATKELEKIMQEVGINYRVLDEVVVRNVSDVLIERYALDMNDASKTKAILGDNDEVIKSTWIVFPRK